MAAVIAGFDDAAGHCKPDTAFAFLAAPEYDNSLCPLETIRPLSTPADMWQFNLRETFIALSWMAALFAVLGYFFRSGWLSAEVVTYLAAPFTGSLLGTAYGVIRARPEPNRWIRAFGVSLVVSCVCVMLSRGLGTLLLAEMWLFAVLYSLPAAVFTACLTEASRMIIRHCCAAAFACKPTTMAHRHHPRR